MTPDKAWAVHLWDNYWSKTAFLKTTFIILFQILFVVSCVFVVSVVADDKQNVAAPVRPSPRQLGGKVPEQQRPRFPRFRFGGKNAARKVSKPQNRNAPLAAARQLSGKQLKKSRAVPSFPKLWQPRIANANARFVKWVAPCWWWRWI